MASLIAPMAAASALLAMGMVRLPANTDGLFAGEIRGLCGVLIRSAASLRHAWRDRAAVACGVIVGFGTAMVMAVSVLDPTPAGIATGLLGAAAAGDARHSVLPETLLPPTAMAAAWAAYLSGEGQAALLSITAVVAIGALLPALAGHRLGMGDIPYLVIASILVPPALLPSWLAAIGFIQAVAFWICRKPALPFAPAIWLATVIAASLGQFATIPGGAGQ